MAEFAEVVHTPPRAETLGMVSSPSLAMKSSQEFELLTASYWLCQFDHPNRPVFIAETHLGQACTTACALSLTGNCIPKCD